MSQTMRAVTYERYGSPEQVLEIREVRTPTPADDEVLVRVRASSINPLDWHLVTGIPLLIRPVFGFPRPKRSISGADVAGVVEEVGKDVVEFVPGDEVFGEAEGGAHAEFVAVSRDRLAKMPRNATFEQAAAMPVAGLTALQGLRDWGEMKPGHRVLVNGASGGVGTFAIQVAKALGGHVTGVCSTRNVDQAYALGVDSVVDYTSEDFTQTDERYDVIFDIPGNRPFSELRPLLEPDGTYVMVGGPKGRWLGPIPRLMSMTLLSMFSGFGATTGTAKAVTEDLLILKVMVETGEVIPAIEHNYKLAEVPEALTAQGDFHSRAKIVVTI